MSDYSQRKSPRLAEFDYTQNGIYFITICVQDHLCLFGKVIDDSMILNAAGVMVGICWNALSTRFENIGFTDYVVMPNHFHGIVIIERSLGSDGKLPGVAEVIQAFKSITTHEYIMGVKNSGWTILNRKLWQRSYHDHIIRNEKSLLNIQQYIRENPLRWAQDTLFGEA